MSAQSAAYPPVLASQVAKEHAISICDPTSKDVSDPELIIWSQWQTLWADSETRNKLLLRATQMRAQQSADKSALTQRSRRKRKC